MTFEESMAAVKKNSNTAKSTGNIDLTAFPRSKDNPTGYLVPKFRNAAVVNMYGRDWLSNVEEEAPEREKLRLKDQSTWRGLWRDGLCAALEEETRQHLYPTAGRIRCKHYLCPKSPVNERGYAEATCDNHPSIFLDSGIRGPEALQCFYCGKLGTTTVDHVISTSKNKGSWALWYNKVPACSACNSKKGSMSPAVWLKDRKLSNGTVFLSRTEAEELLLLAAERERHKSCTALTGFRNQPEEAPADSYWARMGLSCSKSVKFSWNFFRT